MITLNDTEYHLVSVKHDRCHLPGGTECHFSRLADFDCTKRKHHCSPAYGAVQPAIFLTRDEYVAHIAEKFTS